MSEGNACYYDFGDYRLDVINQRLLKNETPVQLTQKSFEILHTLVENHERVVKKEELHSLVWDDCYVEDATLTQHIYVLRKTLKENGGGCNLIETVPKLGYRFAARVEKIFDDSEIGEIIGEPEFEETAASEIEISETAHPPPGNENFARFTPHILPNRNSFSKKAILFASVFGVLAFYVGLSVYFSLGVLRNKTAARTEQVKTIAVLPFKQIAEQKDEKLGVGMADVLISKLGNRDKLRVLPTGSIIRYSEEDLTNFSNIGMELGVNTVLTGTIQREGEDIRVTAHLYDVKERRSLWSGKFDEKFSNIFSIQDTISEQIARELAAKIQTGGAVVADERYTKNIEAHQAYSMGLFHWSKRTEDGLKKAIGDFQTAVEKDPEFVLAHAYLADTYTLIAYYQFDFMPLVEAREKADAAARRALELNPNCSEAMTALAVNQTGDENRQKSFELLKKAIEIKPNNATAHQRIAWHYAGRGNIENALAEMQTAQNLDPQARNTNIGLATLLNYARRPNDSIIYSRRVLELDPNNTAAKFNLAESYEQKGELAEAEKILNEIPQTGKKSASITLMLARIYAKTGRQEQAKKILNDFINKKKADESAYEVALAFTALGNQEAAMKWIEKSVSEGELIYFLLENDYHLDALRENGKLDRLSG